MARIATIIGSSGLIGKALLQRCLEDPYYDQVNVLVRRQPGITHPKLKVFMVDFADEKSYASGIAGAESVFVAVGTTMKQVKGDKDAYKKVDHDIAVNAAKAAGEQGVFNYLLVSSVGADASNNNNFYLKLKGIVEENVARHSIPQLHIFRPSLLLGKREEKRLGEGIAQFLAPVFGSLLFGKFSKYKPVKSETVALSMLAASKLQQRGIFIHDYPEIIQLAARA